MKDIPCAAVSETPDYLTFANIRYLIDDHLARRSLMIDVHTRYLLARLRETAAAQEAHARRRFGLPVVEEAGLD
ncbi:MAG: hypothetical protein AAGI34_07230 [Pseudomonadota bacterium]